MKPLDRILYFLMAALVATLPFEFRSFPILSNPQWLFVAISAASLPIIIRERNILIRHRLVLAAFVFVCTQWLAALLAAEFTGNAIKAAVRVTAGFTLLCATICVRERQRLFQIWRVSASVAGLYGLLDYAGLGVVRLFRDHYFYLGTIARLSGSFEYPNTAGDFLALSLPIIWFASRHRWLRIAGSLLVWLALILTYSRGAAFAVLLMMSIWAARNKTRNALQPLILYGCLLLGVLLFSPSVYHRFSDVQSATGFSAAYEPEYTLLGRRPNEM